MTAHWSFIREQAWMQHMQQQRPHIAIQQLDAALINISDDSGNFSASFPGRVFAAVAVMLPKPTPELGSNIIF